MDFSFKCKYCNELCEISLSSLQPEAKDLIMQMKLNKKDNIEQHKNDKAFVSQSTIFSDNLDLNFVKVDHIYIKDIIFHLDSILKNKICDKCYEKLNKVNEVEIRKLNEEISKVEKTKTFLTEEISKEEDFGDNLQKTVIEDSKSQEDALKRINDDNASLQNELNKNIEKLKKINEEEEKVLNKINELNIDLLMASKKCGLEKSIQQKNQFEQVALLNCNIFDSLFDIEINEKYGVINGCKMAYRYTLSEIYSGWGHILLLTNIINLKAKKYLNILNSKDPYEFYNMGDYSYIIMDKKKFIFYDENSNLNDDSKVKVLNQSMLQYLKVLKDIDNKIKKIKVNFTGLSNFIISDTSINYYHIELNINISDDVDWALCIKSILILLKYYIKVVVYKENEELKSIIPQN